MKKLLLFACMFVAATIMMSCSDDNQSKAEKKIVGTWNMDCNASYTDEDYTTATEHTTNHFTSTEAGVTEFSFTFNEDGTGNCHTAITEIPEGFDDPITWVLTGDTLRIDKDEVYNVVKLGKKELILENTDVISDGDEVYKYFIHYEFSR